MCLVGGPRKNDLRYIRVFNTILEDKKSSNDDFAYIAANDFDLLFEGQRFESRPLWRYTRDYLQMMTDRANTTMQTHGKLHSEDQRQGHAHFDC